jgi:hypothetical protein
LSEYALLHISNVLNILVSLQDVRIKVYFCFL